MSSEPCRPNIEIGGGGRPAHCLEACCFRVLKIRRPLRLDGGGHCLEACCFGFLKIRRPRQAKHDSVPTLRFREVLRPAHCLDTCCLQVLKHRNRPPKRTNTILSFSSHPWTPKAKVLRWKLGHHTALKQLVQTMAIPSSSTSPVSRVSG